LLTFLLNLARIFSSDLSSPLTDAYSAKTWKKITEIQTLFKIRLWSSQWQFLKQLHLWFLKQELQGRQYCDQLLKGNWHFGSGGEDLCKYGFPYCGSSWHPPPPPGPWCEQFWIYITSQSFHVNMTWFWRRRFLNDPTPFLQLSPLWRGPGPIFEQFRIPIT
jgi:hypothetical protein